MFFCLLTFLGFGTYYWFFPGDDTACYEVSLDSENSDCTRTMIEKEIQATLTYGYCNIIVYEYQDPAPYMINCNPSISYMQNSKIFRNFLYTFLSSMWFLFFLMNQLSTSLFRNYKITLEGDVVMLVYIFHG